MVPPLHDPAICDGSGSTTAQEERDHTRRQIERVEESLAHVLFGDYTHAVELGTGDPLWGSLAMHINVAINAARNAIERAEHSEREAARARDEALEAARTESCFLANVTHELRTPLASIRAASEILRDFGPESREHRAEFLDIIVSESERLSRLIENVLDIGKLQAGAVDWSPAELAVTDTVHEAVRTLRPMARRLGVRLRDVVEGEPPPTLADRDRLTQVWTNLLGNAIKFSADGDTVEVRVRGDDAAIAVEVRDRGPGIPDDAKALVFERFRQVAADILTEKPCGTGLGLAIAKEIVDQHGGRIEIDSEVGVGSTFRVVLPVREDLRAWKVPPRRTA